MTPEDRARDLLSKFLVRWDDPEVRRGCEMLTAWMINDAIREAERAAYERAARVAEAEAELEGDMPTGLARIDAGVVARAAVRATKANIAQSIRDLSKEGE